MKIDLAYCVELGRVVDIQEACREFSSQEELTRFHFLCSDEICRNSKKGGVRVTGVNHSRLPEETLVVKSPHFRQLDDHLSDCAWVELEAAQEEALEKNDASEERRRLHKITRLITRFIIPDGPNGEGNAAEAQRNLNEIRKIDDRIERRRRLIGYARGIGATATSLEALVSCFEELRAENALNEKFTVDGLGETTFRDAFKHLTGDEGDRFFVYYGGAWLDHRYGKGFNLRFIDKLRTEVEGKMLDASISFYVSTARLNEYRPGMKFVKMVEEIERNKEKRPYLRVYWIGKIEYTEGKGYGASFASLAHVVMRLVYPAGRQIADDQSSVDSD